MRRRAQLLLATAALTTGLVTALAPVATAGRRRASTRCRA